MESPDLEGGCWSAWPPFTHPAVACAHTPHSILYRRVSKGTFQPKGCMCCKSHLLTAGKYACFPQLLLMIHLCRLSLEWDLREMMVTRYEDSLDSLIFLCAKLLYLNPKILIANSSVTTRNAPLIFNKSD